MLFKASVSVVKIERECTLLTSEQKPSPKSHVRKNRRGSTETKPDVDDVAILSSKREYDQDSDESEISGVNNEQRSVTDTQLSSEKSYSVTLHAVAASKANLDGMDKQFSQYEPSMTSTDYSRSYDTGSAIRTEGSEPCNQKI